MRIRGQSHSTSQSRFPTWNRIQEPVPMLFFSASHGIAMIIAQFSRFKTQYTNGRNPRTMKRTKAAASLSPVLTVAQLAHGVSRESHGFPTRPDMGTELQYFCPGGFICKVKKATHNCSGALGKKTYPNMPWPKLLNPSLHSPVSCLKPIFIR